jgi:hypothetical protein
MARGSTHALLPEGLAEELLQRAAQGRLKESEPRGRDYDAGIRPTITAGQSSPARERKSCVLGLFHQ